MPKGWVPTFAIPAEVIQTIENAPDILGFVRDHRRLCEAAARIQHSILIEARGSTGSVDLERLAQSIYNLWKDEPRIITLLLRQYLTGPAINVDIGKALIALAYIVAGEMRDGFSGESTEIAEECRVHREELAKILQALGGR